MGPLFGLVSGADQLRPEDRVPWSRRTVGRVKLANPGESSMPRLSLLCQVSGRSEYPVRWVLVAAGSGE